jgi:hypothetical protein
MGQGNSQENPTHGLHVLSINPDGNAAKVGIQLYFDLITHINNVLVTNHPQEFPSTPLSLLVFSLKSLSFRQVVCLSPLGLRTKYCKMKAGKND